MGPMNIYGKLMNEIIIAIGNLINFKYTSIISVKKIRNLYEIEPIDSSKINFYWRGLQSLEQSGILKRYGSKRPKKYQVLNFYKFFELLYNAYVDRATIKENSG
jgi:hypothetical protein